MNLFEKIAKKKQRKTQKKKNNILIGVASGLGGVMGTASMVGLPIAAGMKMVTDKKVLDDLSDQEIMDHYNKAYGKSLTNANDI
jgi:hypothetical protein